MAGQGRKTFEAACPHCGAHLTIDAKLGWVLAHQSPAKPRRFADLDDSRRLVEEEAARREAHFRKSTEEEKMKARLLERKFEEAMKRVQDEPTGRT